MGRCAEVALCEDLQIAVTLPELLPRARVVRGGYSTKQPLALGWVNVLDDLSAWCLCLLPDLCFPATATSYYVLCRHLTYPATVAGGTHHGAPSLRPLVGQRAMEALLLTL